MTVQKGWPRTPPTTRLPCDRGSADSLAGGTLQSNAGGLRGTRGADANHLSNVIENKTESVRRKVAAGRETDRRREASLVSPDGNVARKERH